ncbi:MAG: hypothetical protein HWE10_02525 [Gammaproteobacteria bacterium]|nr:hypothetical protein [Gammaproteobacteria bacterium]
MNNKNDIRQKENEYLVPGYNVGQFIRWFGIALLVMAALIFAAYQFGSNENKREINRLNSTIKQQGDVTSLDNLVSEFETISNELKLSSTERTRLTELLDQIISYKADLQESQQELETTKQKLLGLEGKYQTQIDQLQQHNTELEQQVSELELAMSYNKDSVESFELRVDDTHLILDDPSSRMGLHSILNNGSAQLYVGNALMFFHIGKTLRFRFQPNWLCDITMTRVQRADELVEFQYSCKLN